MPNVSRSLAVALALAAPAVARGQAQPGQTAPAAAPVTPVAAAAAAPAAASTRPSLRSWMSDRREFGVGDIVTVLVDDYTITSAIKDDLASQRRQKDLGVDVSISTPSGPGTSAGAKIGSKNNGSSTDRGEARRENRFQSEMSVRVVAVGPNGTLELKGTRFVDVDKGQQNVTLTGWVRPQDVSTANVVESSRIADARLTYLSPGGLGKAKQGILSRVVSIVWP